MPAATASSVTDPDRVTGAPWWTPHWGRLGAGCGCAADPDDEADSVSTDRYRMMAARTLTHSCHDSGAIDPWAEVKHLSRLAPLRRGFLLERMIPQQALRSRKGDVRGYAPASAEVAYASADALREHAVFN